MYPTDKNPRHPSTLRFRDLHHGKEIVVFDTECGVLARGYIIGEPRVMVIEDDQGHKEYSWLEVDVRDFRSGGTGPWHLSDMGVVPYRGRLLEDIRGSVCDERGWHLTNFVVATRNAHLLPRPLYQLGLQPA